ncbi:diguanylate cyclase [Sphingomonas sp. SAFR-052]|uniref:sensor domain-containing diguanylate cyclase n=1 Tax=Sphingomonas sp. SAFR-052 TaxID=3436867 RepID=UPI003F80EEC6
MSKRNRRIGIGLFSGLVYFLSAMLAIDPVLNKGVATMWLASPALLALLIVRSRREWAAILIGATIASLAASVVLDFAMVAAVPMAIAKIGEVVVAMWLFHRMKMRRGFLGTLARIGRYVVAIGIVAPALGATIAATVAALQYDQPFTGQWRTWFVGHGLGMIALTPLFAMLFSGVIPRWWRSAAGPTRVEGTVLLVTTTIVAAGVFGQDRLPLLFLPILPVMLTTFRLGLIGAATSTMVLAAVGSYATLHGMGPANFLGGDVHIRLEFLQLYIASTVLTAFPVAADLSRRQSLYRRLRESEARYRLLADHSSDIVLSIDRGGRIVYLSPSIEPVIGKSPSQLLGSRALELVHPTDRDLVLVAHRDAIRAPTGTQIVEYRARVAGGALSWFEAHTRAVTDEDGAVTGTVSMIRDVSHRKSLEAELSRAASTDPLTGLANRRVFDAALAARIAVAAEGGRAGSVAVFDLDHFKAVNDRFGHAVGDHVLQSFARIARRVVREEDVVARLGGEEFGILFPGATVEQARHLGERLRATLAATQLRHGEATVLLTVSAGIASIDSGGSAAAVLRAADRALYAAKAEGRDRLQLAA